MSIALILSRARAEEWKVEINKYLPEIPIYNFTYKHDDKYLNDSLTLEVEDIRYLKTVIVTTK
jgi:hypothetical protein